MKDLVISTLIIVLLFGGWMFFLNYAEDKTEGFISEIQDGILPGIEAGDWETSRQLLAGFNEDWYRFRSTALYFFDTSTISEIDLGLAKTVKYAEAEDVSNSTGELNAMAEELTLLLENERITLQNIF